MCMINPINYNVISFSSRKSPIEKSVDIHRELTEKGFYDTKANKKTRFDYLYSEIEEFRQAVKNNDRENMEEEIGDVIFDAILLADYYKINPRKALEKTVNKMDSRLVLVKKYAEKPLLEYTFEERMEFWEKAKKELRLKEKR